MNYAFARFSRWASKALGSPFAFAAFNLPLLLWVPWAWSRDWDLLSQTALNLYLSVAAFEVLLAVAAEQNRTAAIEHVKTSELVRAVPEAKSELAALDDKTPEELDRLADEIAETAQTPTPPA